MKLSSILADLAFASTALAKEVKSKDKCTIALEGQTGCSMFARPQPIALKLTDKLQADR